MTKEEKCSITQKNRIVIHLGDLEKRVYPDELQFYLDNGWQKGFSDARKQKLSMNNNGKPAWNKGLTKETNESVKATSEKLTGKPGHQSWNKGLTMETSETLANSIKKGCETRIERYGNAWGDNHMTPEHKAKIGMNSKKCLTGKKVPTDKLKIKLSKEYLTRKKNNSFNKSDPEEQLYETLLKENVNKTIYRQYKDPIRYPFYCDFYIVEDDLFIELNAHWTHGGHPFDPNNEDDLKKLAIWQEKAKTSKFYQIAINTWTVRDVEKASWAKINHLNYKVIY